MDQLVFISSVAAFVFLSIAWGFKSLPKEKWQIMAVLPKKKKEQGKWQGLNLTYYGVLCANAYAFAVFIFMVLSASANVPLLSLSVLIISLLIVCLPASKLVAQVVEKKKGTLTVGGAVFVGTLISPVLVFLVNQTLGKAGGYEIGVLSFLSSISIAYAFGEGLGRLACVSFGCCYGKPLDQCSPFLQKLFSRFYLIFFGETKKISYASDLEGQRVIPIQIITAILYSGCGLIGTWLYLNGGYFSALILTMTTTQLWRFVSEFFRADFRGSLKITPYQIMSLITVVYAVGVGLLLPGAQELPALENAYSNLWNPWIVLLIQTVWAATFFHTGRSMVTGSELSFHVVKDKI